MKKQTVARIAVALFFAALTIIGLWTCDDYGVYVDETWEQNTLRENMHEYAVQFQGEKSAAAKAFRKQKVERISQSTEKDHGQSAYYAFVPWMNKWEDQPQQLHQAWLKYTWMWFMVGVWALYGFCHETGLNRPMCCLGTMLLYLCPRFFAEGHYNNKDMVLLSLVLTTLWLGVRFLKKPCFLRGALLSLAGAMAANTKIAGAFAWAVMGLCAVVMVTADKRWNRRMVCVAASTVVLFAGFYMLLTPAAWPSAGEYLAYLFENATGFTRWTGVVVFRNVLFDQVKEPLPRYYLLWMMAITLPLYVFPMAAMGQVTVCLRVWRQKKKALCDPQSLSLIAASLCWFVPLFLAAILQPTVYNGWRHFYFAYAGIALLAAHGVNSMIRFGRHYGGDCGMHVVLLAGVLLFFGWTAGGMIKNHPYQHSYYNLLGHPKSAGVMELDYWELSTKNAMEQLLTCERNTALPLRIGVMDEMSWNSLESNHKALAPEDRKQIVIRKDKNTPYLFSNSTYARIYGTRYPQGYHVLFQIKSYDVPICTVYERNK